MLHNFRVRVSIFVLAGLLMVTPAQAMQYCRIHVDLNGKTCLKGGTGGSDRDSRANVWRDLSHAPLEVCEGADFGADPQSPDRMVITGKIVVEMGCWGMSPVTTDQLTLVRDARFPEKWNIDRTDVERLGKQLGYGSEPATSSLMATIVVTVVGVTVIGAWLARRLAKSRQEKR